MLNQTTGSQKPLSDLLAEPGPWTVAYVDGRGALPQVEEESRLESVLDRLAETGAPSTDIAAIQAALGENTELPSPSARYVLVRDGRVERDDSFAGAKLGAEMLAHEAIARVFPLMRHMSGAARYLVVETGREGAEVRYERANHHSPVQVEDVEGRDDSLTKVQAGGLSHARFQRSAEEVWKHNQSEVAEVIDRLVLERRPDFIVVAGDVRARQHLREQLGEEAGAMLIEVDSHTRADGADPAELDDAITEAVGQHVRDTIDDAVERASIDDGSAGALGVTAVVQALQQARVDTLVLDARLIDDDRTLYALDAAPWVAEGTVDGLDAEPLGEFPLVEALAGAAILTGARVLFTEEHFDAPDEPRSHNAPKEPLAALRWATDGES